MQKKAKEEELEVEKDTTRSRNESQKSEITEDIISPLEQNTNTLKMLRQKTKMIPAQSVKFNRKETELTNFKDFVNFRKQSTVFAKLDLDTMESYMKPNSKYVPKVIQPPPKMPGMAQLKDLENSMIDFNAHDNMIEDNFSGTCALKDYRTRDYEIKNYI